MALSELREEIGRGSPLLRNPASRFSFVLRDAGSLTLFVDGRSYGCEDTAAALAKRLCARPELMIDDDLLKSDSGLDLLMQLLADGSVAFEPSA